MSEEFKTLFTAAEEADSATGSRGLLGTAQLTAKASEVAAHILKVVTSDVETFKLQVSASKKNNDAMDDLIEQAYTISDEEVAFINDYDEQTIDGMLKSQQSKRSRTKSKVMTIENYRTLLTASIAENMIRLATGKEKKVGFSNRGAEVHFSDEYLEELKVDQEKLRKELRNVQSKKSIMKSKEGFSEEDSKWQALLVAEEQLKSIRTTYVAVDSTKDALSNIFGDVDDISSMKAADAKKLLEQAMALIRKA